MAGPARGRAAAHPIITCGLHLAGGDRRHRLSEQGRDLRPSVQGFRRDDDHNRRRSQTSGRTDRCDVRAAHMGVGAHPPSPCPYDRSGRRHFLGRSELGSLSARLLPAGARAFAAVPPAVSGKACRRPCRRAPARKVEWVVYSKRPFGGPEAVLAYLSRYTHRVAISNSRLLACDGDGVAFKYKDYRIEGRARQKIMRLTTDEFIRRFLIHVLPTGFHRIRHYGLFASGVRAQNIARARELLVAAIPREQDKPRNDADKPEPRVLAHPCPCCGGRMIVIETFERGRASRGFSRGELRIDTS